LLKSQVRQTTAPIDSEICSTSRPTIARSDIFRKISAGSFAVQAIPYKVGHDYAAALHQQHHSKPHCESTTE
jgi:hypothetical protein